LLKPGETTNEITDKT